MLVSSRTGESFDVGRVTTSIVLAALVLGVPAHASLLESRTSVTDDHRLLHGTALKMTSTTAYDVYETTTPEGGHVRQFVNHDGRVFAIAWSGRFSPDLRQLLASHYDQYVLAARVHRGVHHLLSISTPELKLSIVQLPRGFAGSAHLPALLPPGVKPDQLD